MHDQRDDLFDDDGGRWEPLDDKHEAAAIAGLCALSCVLLLAGKALWDLIAG